MKGFFTDRSTIIKIIKKYGIEKTIKILILKNKRLVKELSSNVDKLVNVIMHFGLTKPVSVNKFIFEGKTLKEWGINRGKLINWVNICKLYFKMNRVTININHKLLNNEGRGSVSNSNPTICIYQLGKKFRVLRELLNANHYLNLRNIGFIEKNNSYWENEYILERDNLKSCQETKTEAEITFNKEQYDNYHDIRFVYENSLLKYGEKVEEITNLLFNSYVDKMVYSTDLSVTYLPIVKYFFYENRLLTLEREPLQIPFKKSVNFIKDKTENHFKYYLLDKNKIREGDYEKIRGDIKLWVALFLDNKELSLPIKRVQRFRNNKIFLLGGFEPQSSYNLIEDYLGYELENMTDRFREGSTNRFDLFYCNRGQGYSTALGALKIKLPKMLRFKESLLKCYKNNTIMSRFSELDSDEIYSLRANIMELAKRKFGNDINSPIIQKIINYIDLGIEFEDSRLLSSKLLKRCGFGEFDDDFDSSATTNESIFIANFIYLEDICVDCVGESEDLITRCNELKSAEESSSFRWRCFNEILIKKLPCNGCYRRGVLGRVKKTFKKYKSSKPDKALILNEDTVNDLINEFYDFVGQLYKESVIKVIDFLTEG